jgi:hypothetical protein
MVLLGGKKASVCAWHCDQDLPRIHVAMKNFFRPIHQHFSQENRLLLSRESAQGIEELGLVVIERKLDRVFAQESGIAVHVAVLSVEEAARTNRAKSKPYLEEVGDFTAMGAVGLAGGLGEGHALSPRGCLVFAVVGGPANQVVEADAQNFSDDC